MKIKYFAIVLSLVLCISYTLSGNEVKAGDFRMTGDLTGGVLSPGPSVATKVDRKAPEKSKVEGSINVRGDSSNLQACENKQTILDTTLVQQWVVGVPDPAPPQDAWMDIIGSDTFKTTQITVTWTGSDVLFQILTNFPEDGIGSGAPIGYPAVGGYYRVADLVFDFDLNGSWDAGVALIDHGAIPYDPSNPSNQPPGYVLTADNFVKGNFYSASAWFSADDIHKYHAHYGGKYDKADPKTPAVWMRLGTLLGPAQITWIDLGAAADPRYEIDVLLKGVNTSGKWNKFNVFWGTANCANDAITGQASKPCADRVPGMNEWSALITALLILGSGIWILIRKRAA